MRLESFFLSLSQKELGDRLLPCFKSPSKVPFSDVNLKSGHSHAPEWGPDSSVSEVSTIQLEFRDLSMLTGDSRYQVWEYGSTGYEFLTPFTTQFNFSLFRLQWTR